MVILHGGRPLVGLKRWELLDLVEQAHPLLQLETGQNVDRLLLQSAQGRERDRWIWWSELHQVPGRGKLGTWEMRDGKISCEENWTPILK